jgi:hypothetical protein
MNIQDKKIEIVGLGGNHIEAPNNIFNNFTSYILMVGICLANYNNMAIKTEQLEYKSQLPIISTDFVNNATYVRLTDSERLDILTGFIQKIANSQDHIPTEFEESFRKNRFSLFARS